MEGNIVYTKITIERSFNRREHNLKLKKYNILVLYPFDNGASLAGVKPKWLQQNTMFFGLVYVKQSWQQQNTTFVDLGDVAQSCQQQYTMFLGLVDVTKCCQQQYTRFIGFVDVK